VVEFDTVCTSVARHRYMKRIAGPQKASSSTSVMGECSTKKVFTHVRRVFR
jgi:hypothetical protein